MKTHSGKKSAHKRPLQELPSASKLRAPTMEFTQLEQAGGEMQQKKKKFWWGVFWFDVTLGPQDSRPLEQKRTDRLKLLYLQPIRCGRLENTAGSCAGLRVAPAGRQGPSSAVAPHLQLTQGGSQRPQ